MTVGPALWGALAGACAVTAEIVYKSTTSSYWAIVPFTWPLQILIGLSIYNLVRESGDLVSAIVVFTFSTAIIRAAVTVLWFHDHVSRGAWAALALVVVARVLQAVWK